jgi:alkanesulfonate monooxygenase SsuD/methylene tetrahydromethanopterin reductase-like flavin-dependent oxidoreductase (luciferase family)
MIGFGVNYKDAGRIAEENLAAAEALWNKRIEDEPIELDGFHKGRVLQRIAPTPYGQKHARLMPVAMKEASATRAAVNGWPAFIPAFTPPQIGGLEPLTHVKKYFARYHEQLLAAGHSDETVADALSWTTHSYQCVHLAETDEQAHAEVLEILTSYQEAIEREAAFNAKAESDEANKKTDRTNSALTEEWMATWCLYGSPETVIGKLRAYQELGIGNILCGTVTGPLTEKRLAYADQTLRLLAERVMPAFK